MLLLQMTDSCIKNLKGLQCSRVNENYHSVTNYWGLLHNTPRTSPTFMEQVHGAIGCPPCNSIHSTIVMCVFLNLILPLKHHFINLVANRTYCIWNIFFTSSIMCLTFDFFIKERAVTMIGGIPPTFAPIELMSPSPYFLCYCCYTFPPSI